ncbi:hypothetical protein V1520DRAFT_377738 [Lipomyces starkeyi]|uniref:Uncharacterized protein n=1 Tax=Lipomyces starkeyi NRRL Y-11557 TaxID=675824 RepID=A0A1E3Q5F7_LIPST|nr:hypothetical protein LIPSTDRAFT_320918 [Lipomyces starkeyi NRRL Y-11557]
MASDSDSRPTPELERPQITGDLKFNAVSGNRETNDHKKADFTSDDSTSDALEKQYAIITWDGPDDKDNPMNMSNLRKWAVTLIVSISGLNLVTIYTIPAELHGASAAVLQTAIRDSVRDGLLRHNKQELLRRIIPIGESTISSTDVLGEGSTKTPDGGFRYNDPSTGRQELALIIETGVSGTYQQLRADINVWLSHIHCRAAILLWFKESPSFKNPTNAVAYSVNDPPAFDHAMQHA